MSVQPMQLYQRLLHGCLEIYRVWRQGDRRRFDELQCLVIITLGHMVDLAGYIGTSASFPKAHDLKHVAVDLYLTGSSLGTCTGTN